MARQTKDAATRAQEALDVAERRVETLKKKHAQLQKESRALESDLDTAEKRRDYLAQNPDLPSEEVEAAPRKSDDPIPEF